MLLKYSYFVHLFTWSIDGDNVIIHNVAIFFIDDALPQTVITFELIKEW